MAQTIQMKRGTKAQLAAYGVLLPGEMGFCTDTKEVYIGDGTANSFVGRALSGTEVARPAAAMQGRLYYVSSGTNVGYLYFDDGANWKRVNAQKLTDLSGTFDDITDGALYAKVVKADISSGHINKVSDGVNVKTAAEIKTHLDDVTKHRLINDNSISATDLWSAQKIRNEIELAKHNIEPQASVKDKDLVVPPAAPLPYDRYIISAGAAGAWASHLNKITEWNGTAWDFYTPQVGWTCYVDDEQKVYSWNGTAWVRTGGALQTISAGSGLVGGGQADTVTLSVGAGNGITVAAGAVNAMAGKGILVNATGIEANVDSVSIVYDSAAGNSLRVAVIDGGTF
ncbi:DUF2793 domain-containing protein [Paenibacillus sp. 2TAB23]|uniref:DUF2793 domain-containing protein n=1 Tax=Paenibacillus sp. 2TAB23 TaxID=3233004 RepID=UPI003F947E4A